MTISRILICAGAICLLSAGRVAAVGEVSYYPHRLTWVERYSDEGKAGNHACLVNYDTHDNLFCRYPGDRRWGTWIIFDLVCEATDQMYPTWMDIAVSKQIDGKGRTLVRTPYFFDMNALRNNILACNWELSQVKAVGGEVPELGGYDPNHEYYGAYILGGEYPLHQLIPNPLDLINIPRFLFEVGIRELEYSPNWDQMTAARYTWGQVALTCMWILFEYTGPVQKTSVESLLALALWAHGVWETYGYYGRDLLDELGFPHQIPLDDPRFLSFRDAIDGLYPHDAYVTNETSSWGAVKSKFGIDP